MFIFLGAALYSLRKTVEDFEFILRQILFIIWNESLLFIQISYVDINIYIDVKHVLTDLYTHAYTVFVQNWYTRILV